jgi:hypothetical protein
MGRRYAEELALFSLCAIATHIVIDTIFGTSHAIIPILLTKWLVPLQLRFPQ